MTAQGTFGRAAGEATDDHRPFVLLHGCSHLCFAVRWRCAGRAHDKGSSRSWAHSMQGQSPSTTSADAFHPEPQTLHDIALGLRV